MYLTYSREGNSFPGGAPMCSVEGKLPSGAQAFPAVIPPYVEGNSFPGGAGCT